MQLSAERNNCLSDFLGRVLDEMCGALYRSILKIGNSALTIWGHEVILFPNGNTRPAELVHPPHSSLTQRESRDSNLILAQPAAFSCWFDTVLDHKDKEQFSTLLTKSSYSSLCRSKWGTRDLCKFH